MSKDLTRTELVQLLAYANDCADAGWYYGNRAHFEKRHRRIVEWIGEQMAERNEKRKRGLAIPGEGNE